AAAEALVLLRTYGWGSASEERLLKMARAHGESEIEPKEPDPDRRLLFRWVSGEEAASAAEQQFRGLNTFAALAGWALLNRSWQKDNLFHHDRAGSLIRQAEAVSDRQDHVLQAGLAHRRAYWLYWAGQLSEALEAELEAVRAALAVCGHNHFV